MTILEQLPARVETLAVQISQLRDEMHAEFSEVSNQMHVLRDELLGGIQAGNAEVMTQARVLYEDLKEGLVLIQEGLPARKRPLRRNR